MINDIPEYITIKYLFSEIIPEMFGEYIITEKEYTNTILTNEVEFSEFSI
jgi:hypothetical protein